MVLAQIRAASPEDVDGLVDLWQELATTHERLDPRFKLVENARAIWREHILSVMGNQDSRVLAASEDGVVVGYINGSIRSGSPIFLNRTYGNIDDLYVAESRRRLGIGTQLVESLLGWFDSKGITTYQTSYSVRNPEAEAFWRSAGSQESMMKVTRITRSG